MDYGTRPAIEILRGVEERCRSGDTVDIDSLSLDGYWADIARLFQVYALTRGNTVGADRDKVDALAEAMSSDFFRPYILDRRK